MTKQEMIDIMRGKTQYTGKRWQQLNDVQKDFDEIADYLENAEIVIRCKDCKYATMTCDGEVCKCCVIDTDDFGNSRYVYHDAYWFCADGERKECVQDESRID